MPDTTTILSLPMILPAQAQKHVTHNEALAILDVVVQLAVLNRTLTVPPALPALGDRHIVPAAATSAWAGQVGKVALYELTGWRFFPAAAGWQAFVRAEGKIVVFDGLVWSELTGGGGATEVPFLGIATTANATNKLSVASPASLFTHAGAGHQMKVNKAAAADTASLLFQTGFSGRAEMGTLGSDAFGLKVSANGTTYLTGMSVAAATGMASFPEGIASTGFALRDAADPTVRAAFVTTGLTTGVTRSYTLPNLNGEFALLDGAQTFSGGKTFSGGFTVSGLTASFGTATGAASYGVGAGATTSGASKTVSLATGGVSGSTTTVVIGPATAGALGTLTLNSPTVELGTNVALFEMGLASVRAALMGLGGATADSTNRLSVAAGGVQFSHAGAGVEATVNKATPADQAALSFKTGFSTRAQFGLLGNDALTLRVSANGSTFTNALTADASSGIVTLGQPVILTGQTSDPSSPLEGAVWINSTTGQMKARIGGQSRVIDAQSDIATLIPPVGELIMTVTGSGGGSIGTLTGAAGRVDLFPYVARADALIDRLIVNCTTLAAGALGKIVVYSADASGRPDALVLETGDLDLGSLGTKSATVSWTQRQGRTYWIGFRNSATATISAWGLSATPDLNGGTAIATTARKVLRRTSTYATAAPTTWGYLGTEINAAQAPAIWLRVG